MPDSLAKFQDQIQRRHAGFPISNVQVFKPQTQVANSNLKTSSSNIQTHCRHNAEFSTQTSSSMFNLSNLKSYTSKFQVHGGIMPDFQVPKFNVSNPTAAQCRIFPNTKPHILYTKVHLLPFQNSNFKSNSNFKLIFKLQKILAFPIQKSKYFQRVENPQK